MSLQHFKKKFAKKTKFACATALFVINAKFHPKFLIGKSVNTKQYCGALEEIVVLFKFFVQNVAYMIQGSD